MFGFEVPIHACSAAATGSYQITTNFAFGYLPSSTLQVVLPNVTTIFAPLGHVFEIVISICLKVTKKDSSIPSTKRRAPVCFYKILYFSNTMRMFGFEMLFQS